MVVRKETVAALNYDQRLSLVTELASNAHLLPSSRHFRLLLVRCFDFLGARVALEAEPTDLACDAFAVSRLALIEAVPINTSEIDSLFFQLITGLNKCDFIPAAYAASALSANRLLLSDSALQMLLQAQQWLTAIADALEDRELDVECELIRRWAN